MQIGIIGLGRMGGNIARRLMQHGHQPVVFDRDRAAVAALARDGAASSGGLDELVGKLSPARTIWVMLPAGAITDDTIEALADRLQAGDVIIDGGNTFWRDDIRRAEMLRQRQLHYVDVGTSGGVWGLERGYCMMIGGEKEIVERLDPVFSALAPGPGGIARTPKRDGRDPRAERGYIHAGPNGAGHFVKMVHNGIEYGLMQAYAEGFEIMKRSEAFPRMDLHAIAEAWREGSVVRSWLLDLIADGLRKDPELAQIRGY